MKELASAAHVITEPFVSSEDSDHEGKQKVDHSKPGK